MRRILVTGSAGFIGSAFVRHLLKEHRDIEVVSYDKLTYAGNLENLKEVEDDPRHRFVKGDITDLEGALAALKSFPTPGGIEAIVNFAAETHNDRSVLDPGVFARTNVIGTQMLLEAARRAGIKRFHQISTDEVFGDLGLDEDRAFKESDPYLPRSPYSASKAGADHLVRAYHHTFGLPVTISHCCNNYGPYQFPEKLIPLFATNAMEDKPLPLFKSSRNSREWIHADDHSAAVDLILQAGRPGESYNIGTGEEKTVEEVTNIILDLLAKPASLKTYVPDRPGLDRRYLLDSSKIRSELDWRPRVNFDEGMRRTIDWYRDNFVWWQRIKDGSYREYYEKYYTQTLGVKV
jgi:dTDP-glucose 4,6-dehydratase